MFGIDSAELLIIAVVALVVIGPKDLPRVMRTIGNFVGKARGMAKHFRSGLDTMMREAELEDMEKKWRSDNERIMREHPIGTPPPVAHAEETKWGQPDPSEAPADGSRSKPKAPPRSSQSSAPAGAAPVAPAPTPPASESR